MVNSLGLANTVFGVIAYEPLMIDIALAIIVFSFHFSQIASTIDLVI
jgi:hypothetical protein